MKGGRIVAAAAVLAVAACGGAHLSAGAPSPSATPAAGTTASATPAPTAVPTPLPPLAIITDDAGMRAVDGTGAVRWKLPQAAMARLVSAGANDSVAAQTAGPNVLLTRVQNVATSTSRTVTVVNRSGTVLGSGTLNGDRNAYDTLAGAPDGTEWAWSVDNSIGATAPHHGDVMVAGLGTAARAAYAWVAPVNCSEQVGAWTDMGIVLERVCYGGCGIGFHDDSASFLVDPVAGTLTDLFSGGQHYLDARHGVRVALAATSATLVLINNNVHNDPGTVLDGGFVSTDGARVGLARLTPVGCSGGLPTYRLTTQLVDMATAATADLAGCEIRGWFDATHFVGVSALGGSLSIFDLRGKPGPSLGSGSFVGVVAGP